MKTCANCSRPIILGRYCKDPICQEVLAILQEAKQKERYTQTYQKKQKSCPTCKEDITDLWPQRTCNKEFCKLKWKHRKKKTKKRSYIKYDKTVKYPRKKCRICGKIKKLKEDGRSHTCNNNSCKKRWALRIKKKRQKRERERWHTRNQRQKELQCIKDNKPKTHENLEHIDKLIDKINKPNGRRCQKCNKVLYGNYHRTCPTCLKGVNDVNLEAVNSGYW
jgi:hypothetical protein